MKAWPALVLLAQGCATAPPVQKADPRLASQMTLDEAKAVFQRSHRWTWADGSVDHAQWGCEYTDAGPDPQQSAGPNARRRSKLKLDVLEAVMGSGKRSLRLEPGSPFFGFWNVLRSAIAMSGRKPFEQA